MKLCKLIGAAVPSLMSASVAVVAVSPTSSAVRPGSPSTNRQATSSLPTTSLDRFMTFAIAVLLWLRWCSRPKDKRLGYTSQNDVVFPATKVA